MGSVYRLSLPQKLLKKMFTYKMYKNVSDVYGKWMRDFAAEYKLTFSAGKVSEEWEVNDFMQKMIQEVYEYVDEKNEFKMAYFGASKEWTNLSAEQILKIKTPTESGYILGYISTRMKYWLNEKGANDGTLRIERLQE